MKQRLRKILCAATALIALLFGVNSALASTTGGIKNVKRKAAHPKTVRINVTKKGFSPSSISAEQGSPLTLIFRRKSKEGCGNRVVFPALNISRDLPVGKSVTVKFTPRWSGAISFTCGMGMYKGSVVVHED